MEISISIIDKAGSKVSDEANIRLLWTAVLIGESVNASCNPVTPLHLIHDFDSFSEKQKFTIYLEMLKNNPANTEEVINSMRDLYSKVVLSRNMRGKTKKHIVLQMSTEKLIKNLFDDYKSFLTNVCIEKNTASLLPLTTTNSFKWDKPLLAWYFPDNVFGNNIHERIKIVSETLTDSGWFPFFDSVIGNFFTIEEMSKIPESDSVNIISDLLVEIPEPFLFTTSQIHLVRNDLSKTSWKYFGEMKKLNEELKEIPFEQNNFEKIVSLYREKISPLKPAIQKTVDENPCFNAVKNENQSRMVFQIHAAISSFANILSFYKELDIIDVSNVLYVQEEIGTRASINNSRLFLFLVTIEK